MFAGVPSRTLSAASRSAAPADSAGRRTSSASSTIATPSFTASRTAWRAGEGVWWTTSRRGTQASSPAGPMIPPFPRGRGRAEAFPRERAGRAGRSRAGASRDQRCPGLGGESSDQLAVAHEDADDVVQVHAFAAGGHGVGQGWFAGGEQGGADRPVSGLGAEVPAVLPVRRRSRVALPVRR